MKTKYLINRIVAVIIVLALISLALGLFSPLALWESFRIVFGSVLVLFLPGFIITYIFFPKTKGFDQDSHEGAIDWLERIALSFALSIAIVPLVVFYFNLARLKISALNSFIVILVIMLVSLGILYWKKRRSH